MFRNNKINCLIFLIIFVFINFYPVINTVKASKITNNDYDLLFPGFKLPYDRNVQPPVKWTGGPHAYNSDITDETIPAIAGSGLDFSNGMNFAVEAMASGDVIASFCASPPVSGLGYGCQIAIKHFTGGSVMVYAHLREKSSFNVGDRVIAGNIIGYAGDTGNQTNVHLHIDLRDGGICDMEEYCLSFEDGSKGLGGNPYGWALLNTEEQSVGGLVDGYDIYGYWTGHDIRNYDGSAVKGPAKVMTDFRYNDATGNIENVTAFVSIDFHCDPSVEITCEDNSNKGTNTQFAMTKNKGGLLDQNKTELDTTNDWWTNGGKLLSTNGTETNYRNDSATFISDLSLPDGTIVSPSQSLTKTWRLENTGSTSWNSGYQLVFLRGDRMGAPASIDVPTTSSGQTVDLSVPITSPASSGSYKGYWRLRNSQGTYFGPEIWVSLQVATQGSHITVFSADPPPPADTSSVTVRAMVENYPNFRAMRFLVDGNVMYEIGSMEVSWTWNTSDFSTGTHSITVEVADQTDTSWSRSEKRSMVYSLTGTGASNNHVPNRPTLSSPYDWIVFYSGNTATLCAQADGDPDGDAITSYYFEVSGAENWTSGWVSNNCVTTAGMGPHNYGWRVKVRDSRGGVSDWSDTWHYTLVNQTLSITQFDFQPLDSNSEQVRIRACTAGQGGIGITMKVMVNESNDGTGNGKWNTIYELGVPCFNDIDAPTWNTLGYSDGTHLVRVEAHGLNTGWDGAAVQEKTYTLPHRRPAGPELFAPVPASRDSNEAVFINSQTIDFKWGSTLRSNSYTLHVSLNPDPQSDTNPILRQVVGGNNTEYTATFNQDYPTLYWKVTANGDAGSSSSNAQKWGIDRTPPACSVEQLPTTVYENAFTVYWQGSDNLSGINKYGIQFLDTGRSDWVDWQTFQPSSKTFDLFIGQPGHTYSFRCRSVDNANNEGIYLAEPDTSTMIDPLSRPPEPWWNLGYSYKRNLIVLNSDNDLLPQHYPVHVHFDNSTTPTSSEIFNASVAAVKGNDLRVVYQNQIELNRVIQRFTSNQIDIWLPLQTSIVSGISDAENYQIYYGNANAGTPPANVSDVFLPEADANTVGVWHFQDGTGTLVRDGTVNANNGTFSNGSWSNGFLGWTGAFNGTSSAVTIPNSPVFNTTAITVEAWINLTSYNNQAYPIVMKRLINTPGGFEFHITNDRELRWITENGWLNSSVGLNLNQWYHVAATSNGVNQICIYINGIVAKCQQGGAMAFNSAAITIGFIHNGDGDLYFPGYIQHVRISNIARNSFPYARIDTQPSIATGIQQIQPVVGNPDLAILSITAYLNPEGKQVVAAVVENRGNLSTTNGFYTDLYIDHLPTGAGDFEGSLQFWVNDPISAGGTATLTTIIEDPVSIGLQSSKYSEERIWALYAQTDSTGAISESDKSNNIFPSGVKTEQFIIQADEYDGFEDANLFNISGDGNKNNWIGSSPSVMSGWIFANVDIPQNARIINAKLYLRGYGMNGTSTTRLLGFAEDNAMLFTSNGTNKPSTRESTQALVDWTATRSFTWQTFESPDISGVIQEIVNRPGWSSGNNLGIKATNPSGTGSNWTVADYSAGTNHHVLLEVTYEDFSLIEICFAATDEYETIDGLTGNNWLVGSQEHNFNLPGDEDWMKIEALAGKEYVIQTTDLDENTDTYLYVYGPDRTTLITSNDDYGATLASHVTWAAEQTGTYYVLVKQWNPNAGGCVTRYTIDIIDYSNNIFIPMISR